MDSEQPITGIENNLCSLSLTRAGVRKTFENETRTGSAFIPLGHVAGVKVERVNTKSWPRACLIGFLIGAVGYVLFILGGESGDVGITVAVFVGVLATIVLGLSLGEDKATCEVMSSGELVLVYIAAGEDVDHLRGFVQETQHLLGVRGAKHNSGAPSSVGAPA